MRGIGSFARIGRYLVWGVGLGLAAFSYVIAVAAVVGRTNAKLAYRVAPWTAGAQRSLADTLGTSDAAERSQVESLATGSLRTALLNPGALRLLGSVRLAQGRSDEASRLFQAALRQSRREAVAQLSLADVDARKGDLQAALRRIDIAMRTNRDMRTRMSPLLLQLSRDPNARMKLAQILAASPPWAPQFIGYAVASRLYAGDAAAVILAAKGFPQNATREEFGGKLLSTLIAGGRQREARDFYTKIWGDKDNILVDPSFNKSASQSDTPIGWTLVQNDVFDTHFTDGRPTLLEVQPYGNGTTTVAARILYLPPGTYSIRSMPQASTSDDDLSANWTLQCILQGSSGKATDGAVVLTLDALHHADAAFAFGATCPAQRLSLTVGFEGQSYRAVRFVAPTIGKL